MNGDVIANYEEILVLHARLHQLMTEHWRQHEVFTLQWWMLLAVLIIPWFIWWRLADRRRMAVLLCYGAVISFLVITMDAMGIAYHMWIYPVKLIPVIPHAIPIDWSLLPVMDMLVYQYFPRWKAFLVAEGVMAAALAFVGEPLAEWLGVYHALNWYHMWSVPIYWAKGVAAKWLVELAVDRRR